MAALIQNDVRHGSIMVDAPPRLWLPKSAAVIPSVRVRHTLPARLADSRLQAAVELELIGWRGQRRFAPAGDVGVFLQTAYAVGLSFLSDELRFTARTESLYRLMKFIHTVACNGDRPVSRRLKSIDDLVIRGSKARRGRDRSLLPEHLGLDGDGSGRRWSPERLIEEGRRRAAADGYAVDEEAAIRYGFLAAAERNPLRPVLNEKESGALLRLAMFDDSKLTVKATPELVENVGRRWESTLYERAKSEWSAMRNGLIGAKNNLATSLARRTDAGGRLSTSEARVGLAELGWYSHRYFADCIDAWAEHFLLAFPERLTAGETSAFELMYRSHPNFGGLAPIMFHERLALLKPIYEQLEHDPADLELLGTAQRILSYYGEIVAGVRATDRIKKQDQGGDLREQETGRAAFRERVERLEWNEPSFHETVEGLARKALSMKGVGCPQGNCELEVGVDAPDDLTLPISVVCRCLQHGWSQQTQLSVAEFVEASEME